MTRIIEKISRIQSEANGAFKKKRARGAATAVVFACSAALKESLLQKGFRVEFSSAGRLLKSRTTLWLRAATNASNMDIQKSSAGLRKWFVAAAEILGTKQRHASLTLHVVHASLTLRVVQHASDSGSKVVNCIGQHPTIAQRGCSRRKGALQ